MLSTPTTPRTLRLWRPVTPLIRALLVAQLLRSPRQGRALRKIQQEVMRLAKTHGEVEYAPLHAWTFRVHDAVHALPDDAKVPVVLVMVRDLLTDEEHGEALDRAVRDAIVWYGAAITTAHEATAAKVLREAAT